MDKLIGLGLVTLVGWIVAAWSGFVSIAPIDFLLSVFRAIVG